MFVIKSFNFCARVPTTPMHATPARLTMWARPQISPLIHVAPLHVASLMLQERVDSLGSEGQRGSAGRVGDTTVPGRIGPYFNVTVGVQVLQSIWTLAFEYSRVKMPLVPGTVSVQSPFVGTP